MGETPVAVALLVPVIMMTEGVVDGRMMVVGTVTLPRALVVTLPLLVVDIVP
jgi:hypothetical protein